MQQKTRTANNLRALVDENGWKMRELAQELGVVETTLHSWASGKIPHRYRAEIARLLGCDVEKLAPQHDRKRIEDESMEQHAAPTRWPESDRCFSFGHLKTSEIILDGDGSEIYLPQHIHSHYIPIHRALPDEFEIRKEQIRHEQEQRKARGESYQWNGERYNLTRFVMSREPANEEMNLHLWFAPSDYYTFLATSNALQEPEMRARYLSDVEWDEAIPLFAHSFSALIAVITSDGYVLLVQRGKGLGCRPNAFDVSLAEGLSRPLDRSITSQAPDIYRCAMRGLAEETGLHPPVDFARDQLVLTTFAVDTEFAMWGLFGFVKVERTAEEVISRMNKGVRDRFENRKLFPVPFTPEDIAAFIFEHQPFSPGGLVCLYHALVHEFGRETVDRVVEQESKKWQS